MKIPLAWLQLKREKIRLLVALAGIAFANILMFVQLGFQDALFDSGIRLHQSIQGDIFLVSPNSTNLISMKSFPQRRLYQALSFDGVKSISSLYLNIGQWKVPKNTENTVIITDKKSPIKNYRPQSIFVIGINPEDHIFDLPGIEENINKIKMQDVVLLDANSRGEFFPDKDDQLSFGDIHKWFDQGKDINTEIENRKIKVEGLFTLGASFGANGNIITSDLNFLRLFKRREKGLIDIGVIKVYPGADIDNIITNMQKYFDICQFYEDNQKTVCPPNQKDKTLNDIKILSKEDFINLEKNYWQKNTSIGFIFRLGTMMGFVVGIIIVYQILYTDVSDHLPEYATLKAMGYKDVYLLSVVFQQALILAILGYIPGFTVALRLYNLTKNATNLPIGMTIDRAIIVLLLTFIMCFVSGAIAVRRLSAADPADIF